MRNFRQALASPHPGGRIHDHVATVSQFSGGSEAMTKLSRLFSIAVVGAVLTTGCAARGVRIAELKDRPDKYDRKTVSVEGVVTRSIGAGLLGQVVPFQTYTV